MAALGAVVWAQSEPIDMAGTVPVVELRINGRGPFRFAVDTGAASCSVLPRVWNQAGPTAQYRVELTSRLGARLVPATSQARIDSVPSMPARRDPAPRPAGNRPRGAASTAY